MVYQIQTMTEVSTNTILVQSLTPDIALFRQNVQNRNETRAFALAIKLLGFIETDREFLWSSNDSVSDTLTDREEIVVSALTKLRMMMHMYNAIDDEAALLSAMMIECARLLLLFNGDNLSDNFIDREGLCYMTTPALRPKDPLAVKFGICKLSFVRERQSAADARTCESTMNIDALDYDQISTRGPLQLFSKQVIEWQSFSLLTQMNEILDELEINKS